MSTHQPDDAPAPSPLEGEGGCDQREQPGEGYSRVAHKPSTRWKWARRTLLCLILGAVVNVAVAWGAVLGAWKITPARDWPQSSGSWPMKPTIDWPENSNLNRGSRCFGIATRHAEGGEPWDGGCVRPHNTHYISVWECGWPVSSFTSWRTIVRGVDRQNGLVTIRNRAFPAHPLWWGFAFNTLIYTPIFFMPTLGISALKRRRRSRRGLCTNCAYDLAGLPSCPECGIPSSPPAA